jgi:protocatechuate 3,4-dioxygenase beta subunit
LEEIEMIKVSNFKTITTVTVLAIVSMFQASSIFSSDSSTLAGRVVDSAGQPVAAVQVELALLEPS